MATKPSSILGYNPSRSACVTIPSGKMAAGFLPGEKPPAQYLGDIFERVDRWLEYVKDGAWTGNTTIAGTLGVTGNTSIGGTLGVTGLVSSAGGLDLTGSAKLSHAATRYIPLHANAFSASPSSTVSQRTQNSLALNPCVAFAAPPFVSGMRIVSIRLLVLPQGTATLRGVLHASDINTGVSPTDVTTNTSVGATSQILSATGLSFDVLPDSIYTFYVEEVVSGGASISRIFGAIIGYITPP